MNIATLLAGGQADCCGGMGGWGYVGMAAFWVAVVAIAGILLRSVGRGSASPSSPTPLEVLARRYAAGDISAEEFREGRAVLAAEPPD